MKYDWKFKLDCVLKHKKGIRDFVPVDKKSITFLSHFRDWVKNYDDLGIER